MAENNTLEPLGLSNDEENNISRNIEWMTKKQAFCTIILFALCNIIIILCIILGPPYFRSQKMDFPAKFDFSATNRFSFDFTGLDYFNDFLTLDLRFNRGNLTEIGSINISVFFHASMTMGSKLINTIQARTRTITVFFSGNNTISDKIRLFAQGSVKFDSMHSLVTFKHMDYIAMPGEFEWNYADPSHSIVQIFLRVIVFLISLFMLIRLILSDFNVNTSFFPMKMMYYLDYLLIIASNPLFFLSYFTSSPLFSLIDSLINLFLLINTAFLAIIVLFMSNLTHSDVSKCWIVSHYIPFFASFCLLSAEVIYTAKQIASDPLSTVDHVIRGLGIAKFTIFGIYFVSLLIAIATYKTDVPNEKPTYSLMSLILVSVIFTSEYYSATDPYLGTDLAVRTFSFMAVSTYLFFFNFISWPSENVVSDNDNQNGIEDHILSNVVEDNE